MSGSTAVPAQTVEQQREWPLRLRDLTVAFGDNLVVDRLSFDVADGEFIAMVGPSGCGKSTTLNAISRLLTKRRKRKRKRDEKIKQSKERGEKSEIKLRNKKNKKT